MKYKGYFEEYEVDKVEVGSYAKGLPIYIQLYGKEEPLATVTVNLGDSAGNGAVLMPFVGFVDTNNNPGIMQFLNENGFGEPFKRFGAPVTVYSGYCEYPVYEFNRQKLAELDPEGTERYYKTYCERMEKARKKFVSRGAV